MMNFIQKKFIKMYLGDKKIRSHIDAVHAHPPKSDEFTGDIVERIIQKINCSGIVATTSRTVADINRPRQGDNKEAIDEYRYAIREILNHVDILSADGKLLKPYLHLAIHGMRDNRYDIEIGTRYGETCTSKVRDWFIEEIEKDIKRLLVDQKFIGDPSKSIHRCGDKISDSNYFGYGDNFNTFQIEIGRALREKHQGELIEVFCHLIENFNKKF